MEEEPEESDIMDINDESLFGNVELIGPAEVDVPLVEEHETAGVDNEIDLLAGIHDMNMDEEDSETAQGGITPYEILGVNEANRTARPQE
jgi:hypothetical protein